MSTDVIRIKNALFYAYHGVAQDEQNLGGKFEVDADMRCDLSKAKSSDSLQQTVDYEAVFAVIRDAITSKKYFLLEALSNSIASALLAKFLLITEVTIRIRKPHPPVKGVVDYVEVEVTKQRSA
ncbi:MAG TPA: dihydroneopterin aldolase [Bacteroidota bacterium]|nr:dihydroneopterin aldolase [Bacteroidota bacterium]